MLKRGGGVDTERAAVWFVKWWRNEGCLLTPQEAAQPSDESPSNSEFAADLHVATQSSQSSPSSSSPADTLPIRGGWGFDFEWELDLEDVKKSTSQSTPPSEPGDTNCGADAHLKLAGLVQSKMGKLIDDYYQVIAEEQSGGEAGISVTQAKKRLKEEQKRKREKKVKAMLEARRAS